MNFTFRYTIDKNFFLDSTRVLYEGFQKFLTKRVGFCSMCFERFIYEFDPGTNVSTFLYLPVITDAQIPMNLKTNKEQH